MLQVLAVQLKVDDEFTIDGGTTWWKVTKDPLTMGRQTVVTCVRPGAGLACAMTFASRSPTIVRPSTATSTQN